MSDKQELCGRCYQPDTRCACRIFYVRDGRHPLTADCLDYTCDKCIQVLQESEKVRYVS